MKRMTTSWVLAGILSAGAACGDDTPKKTDTADAVDTSADTTAPDAEDTSADTSADTADTGPTPEQAAILGVPETARYNVAGLTATVHVVRTEGSTPHIYAENQNDLGRVLGFVHARDRFFFMDLQRRLGLGTLSELLGAVGLAQDIEARGTGMTYVTDRIVAHLSPEFTAYLESYAAGVNDYIEAVRQGTEPEPTETQFAGLLGYDSAADMMKPFALRDVVALVTVFMYSTNFETDDVGRAAAQQRVLTEFEGKTDEALRTAGYYADVFDDATPIFPGTNTTPGFGPTPKRQAATTPKAGGRDRSMGLPQDQLERLYDKLKARMLRMGKDREAGFGSNVWAVAGTHSATGAAILANDGHLELSVPPLGYGAALDTRVFGGGNIHHFGGWLGNFPVMIGGTNGDVAWGGVNPVLDITDWYREELLLDANGRPTASRFNGEWRPLVAIDEDYDIANVPLLDSVGRTETWTRWTTFDGRIITSVEGRPATTTADAGAGESVINLLGDLVVPADMDGDAGSERVVEAVSFDYVALDATKWPEALFRVGLSKDVEGVFEETRGYVGAALFTGAVDQGGSILYTSYQAVPCRGYLPREDGVFADGADPTQLLDGTRYGGFTIPTDADGKSDEGPGATDPYQCVLGRATMPHAIDPPEGFIFNANNDPAGLTDDGDERNDEHYIGGPWASVRANTIRRDLLEATADKQATVEDMKATQANIDSRLGELFVPYLQSAAGAAKTFAATREALDPAAQRMADLYTPRAAAIDEALARLAAWGTRGYSAESGVETFYETPTADERADASATMIFNVALRRFLALVWDDEGASSSRWGGENRVAAVLRFLEGRGAGNPKDLASWNPATNESVFFDVLGTEDVERSDELLVRALAEALDFLASPPSGAGEGGFGTADMDAWLWGLRHQVRFESILGSYIGGNAALSIITDLFSISTERIPLMDSLPAGDPRLDLKWFPRGGDQWAVDAANPGLGGTRFTYGSGPAMRLVFALKDGKVEGGFTLPGGQSARTDSPYFADQVQLWLGNEYMPAHFAPADVAAHALGREVYLPK